MQSINMEFVQNLLASFQELQRSYSALQKRMAEFEAMAAARFEAYEAELAKKDAVIASLRATIAKQEAELERYRDKDKTNSNNSHMSPSKDKTKAVHKEKKSKGKSAKKQGAQPGHKGWWNVWKGTGMKYAYFSPISLCPLTTTKRSAISGQ